MSEINNSFHDAIDKNSDAQENITELEWIKIKEDKEKILSGINDDRTKKQFEHRYNKVDQFFFNGQGEVLSETTKLVSGLKEILGIEGTIDGGNENQDTFEFFNNEGILKNIQETLEQEIGLDITNVLESYQQFIEDKLSISEGSQINLHDHRNMINNIKTLIVTQLMTIKDEVLSFKEKYDGNLDGMQWEINSILQDELSILTDSLFSSALLFVQLHQNNKGEKLLSVDWGSLNGIQKHTRKTIQNIEESLVQNHVNIGDEVPRGLIGNRSILNLQNKQNEAINDEKLTERLTFISGGDTIKNNLSSVKEVTFLNETDKKIEDEATVAILGLVGLCCVPYVGAIPSALIDIMDAFSSEDQLVVKLKELGFIEKSYHMPKHWYDNVLAIVSLAGTFIGAQAAIKSVKLQEVMKKMERISLPKERVNEILKNLGQKMGFKSEDLVALTNSNMNKTANIETDIHPDVAKQIEYFDKNFPEKFEGPDDTIIYRYADNESGINIPNGENGVNSQNNGVGSYWHVGEPHGEYTSAVLIKTTIGDLKKEGIDIRVDNLAPEFGENSVSLVGIADKNLVTLPGERQIISGYGIDGKTPIILNNKNEATYLDGEPVDGRWTGKDGNVYFADEALDEKTIDSLKEGPENISDIQSRIKDQIAKILERNNGLTEDIIRQNSMLSDSDRIKGLQKDFPELSPEQINRAFIAHKYFDGEIFELTELQKISKAKFAMGGNKKLNDKLLEKILEYPDNILPEKEIIDALNSPGLEKEDVLKAMDYGYLGKAKIELGGVQPQVLGNTFARIIQDGIYEKYGFNPEFINKKLIEPLIKGDEKAIAQIAKKLSDSGSGYSIMSEILGYFDLKDIYGNKLIITSNDLKDIMKLPRIQVKDTQTFLKDLDSLEDSFFSKNFSTSRLSLNGNEVPTMIEIGDMDGYLSVQLVKDGEVWKSYVQHMSMTGTQIIEYFSTKSSNPREALQNTLNSVSEGWNLDVLDSIDQWE